MMKLTESLNEVYLNVQEFAQIHTVENSLARDRFTRFYHWYYFPHIDVFAPSKFIGYKNTTLENYSGRGAGTETQKVLKKWFTKLKPASERFEYLRNKLENLGQSLGSKINQKLYKGKGGIYLLKGSFEISDYPEEITDKNIEEFVEGGSREFAVNTYERNSRARSKCIEHYGTNCCVCDLNFGDRYGVELGSGFIHVHHLKEISSIGKEYVIDPIQDLRPVCPNCHAMLHRQKPAISIIELKQRLNT